MSEFPEETASVASSEEDPTQHNISLESDSQYAADNSIIGKVKSRVSSILPNRISKWFTTTSAASNNSSLNGSFMSTSILAKRRRHLDDDDDDDDDIDIEYNEENNDDINENPTDQMNDHRYQSPSRNRSNIENDISEPNIHVNDDNYVSLYGDSNSIMDRYILRQPPSKRSRFENLTENDNNSTLLMSQQRFVSSTPATHSTNVGQQFHADSIVQRPSYKNHNCYTTNTKLCSSRTLKKEPAYDFTKATVTTTTSAIKSYVNLDSTCNVLNNRQEPNSTTHNIYLEQQSSSIYSQPSVSSRKILNIPPLSSLSSNVRSSERFGNSTLHLKRQPLSSVKMKCNTGLSTANHPTTHTLCDIINDNEDDYGDGSNIEAIVNDGKDQHEMALRSNFKSSNKKQKLLNGSADRKNETIMLVDTASESEDSNDDSSVTNRNIIDNDDHEQFNQRKMASYNLTATKTVTATQSAQMVTNSNVNDNNNKRPYEHDYDDGRNQRLDHGSLTSSYGNDLNFYSHLEGHKSLFGGSVNSTRRGTANETSTLNNSTLSLSSLNRRQFNASIYGSTSALSDSRLLNTFSPFYKGRTTYGGAAAYNKKYCGIGSSTSSSMGTNSIGMRITPTIIRPTSSLSNLSTPNNSLLNISGHHLYNPCVSDNNSAISSTAKRILELITDINTPLSDAKKMAHSLRPTPPQARKRLNDNDVNAIRSPSIKSIRLSRAPKPYSRPNSAVLLQSKRSGCGSGSVSPSNSCNLPPIKELQVPSMSQLLQMKRMQNITEKARHIATQNIQNNLTAGVSTANATTGAGALAVSSASSALCAEYDLPQLNNSNGKQMPQQLEQGQQQKQQQHTNKIKNKTNMMEEEPPSPPNLPNIKFPLMQSRPIFDIQLPIVSAPSILSLSSSPSSSPSTSATITTSAASKLLITSKTSGDFQFSSPLTIEDATLTPSQSDNFVAANRIYNYNFSMPTFMPASISNDGDRHSITLSMPQPLKDGSVLEVLKSTLKNSDIDMPPATTTSPKTRNEWECNTCWVRNKIDTIKCVACGMQQSKVTTSTTIITSITTTATTTTATATTTTTTTSQGKSSNPIVSFGNQFKRANGEWDCDVCMIRNKMDATRCVACEAQRKNVTSPTHLSTPTTPSSAFHRSVNNTFGDAFKSKGNTWECKTCLIMNNIEVNECVACQSRRPGLATKVDLIKANANTFSSSSIPFKFGFTNGENHISTMKSPDAGFKALASQQKHSKWECEACMTRNDAVRKKCACCEQPRLGLVENIDNTGLSNETKTAKFVFGATAKSTNYTFGFGPLAGTQKEEDLQKETSNSTSFQNTNTLTENQMMVNDTDKTIEIQSQFQLQPAKDKDITDSVNKMQQNENSQATRSTTTTSSALPANLQKPFESSNVTSTTATATPIVCTAANITFNLTTTSNNKSLFTATSKESTSTKTTTAVTASTPVITAVTFNSGSRLNCSNQEKLATSENIFKTFSPNFSNSNNVLSPVSGFTFESATANKQQIPLNNSIANSAIVASSSTAISTPSTQKSTFGMPISTVTVSSSTNNKNNSPFGGFVFGANAINTSNIGTKSTSLENAATQSTASANVTNTFSITPTTISVSSSTNATTSDSSKVINNATQNNIFGGIVSSSTMTSPITNTSSNVFAITNNANNNNNNNNKPQSSNLFSSFGGNKSSTTATTQSLFGSSNSTASSFTFGLAAAKSPLKTTVLATNIVTTATISGMAFTSTQAVPSSSSSSSLTIATTTTVGAWPKSNFIFGANSNDAKTDEGNQQNQNTMQGASSMFTFGSTRIPNANANNASSIFGAAAAAAAAAATVAATTSTSVNNNNIFGSNAATPSSSGSLFGAAFTNTAPAHVFGNATFGGVSSSSASTPSSVVATTAATSMITFGSASTSATSSTFGGFGVLPSNETKSAILETKPSSSGLSFTFGANNNTAGATTPNVGFNFSSAATTKTSTAPVFNFGSVAASGTISQPTFNFTGINEQSQNVVKPFQFGATPLTPFYKFTGGATEVAPNAPFQFNAAPMPTTNNIFAPNSMPGTTSTQQARRKIRPPVRRLTPR